MQSLRYFVVAALVCARATIVFAAPVGTALITAHVQGTPANNVLCTRTQFNSGSHDVFGTNVDMAADAGDIICTGSTVNSVLSVSCHSYPDNSKFTFDATISAICNPADCSGIISFVSTSFSNVAGTVPASIGNVDYVFDGVGSVNAFPSSTDIPGCGLSGSVIQAQGSFGLNAFQNVATSPGTDVTVSTTTDFFNPISGTTEPVAISATFSSVDGSGETTITASSSASPTLSSNFSVAVAGYQPIYFDVRTTAPVSGPITICGPYADANDDGFLDGTSLPESQLYILHEEAGAFVDRTSSRDVDGNIICATVSSLSYFVMAEGPPANDDCSSPTVIATVPYNEPGLDTSTATAGSGPTLGCGNGSVENSVWYSYTPAIDGVLEVDTSGSDYDTIVAVYSGMCGSLTELGCNDDSIDNTSLVTMDVTGGETYLIEITGYHTGGGLMVLNLRPPVVPPANDDCSTPTVIASLPFEEPSEDTTLATSDDMDPEFECIGDVLDKSVWFSYTATTDGVIQIDASNSDYYAMVAVYTGSCGAENQVGCGILQTNVSVTAGVTYLIEVADYDLSGGELVLDVQMVTPPTNDECSSPAMIASLPFDESGLDSTLASSAASDPVLSCTELSHSNSVWYAFTPPAGGTLTVSTIDSDYDTVVAVHSGSCGALTEIGCDDDGGGSGTSIVETEVTCGTTYLIEVASYGSGGGNLVMNVELDSAITCPETPSDDCAGSAKSTFALGKDPTDANKSKLVWKWTKGTVAVAATDFGDPATGCSSYHLCVYDETAGFPTLMTDATVAAGGTCNGKPCWKAKPGKGFSFKNKTGAGSSGITKLSLTAGAAGKAKIQVAGKGTSLPLPAALSSSEFFDQDTAVLVQLRNTGNNKCWASSYSAANTKKNDATHFKATTK